MAGENFLIDGLGLPAPKSDAPDQNPSIPSNEKLVSSELNGLVNAVESIRNGTRVLVSLKGDLLVWNGVQFVQLSAGADGQVLKALAAAPSGLQWGAASGAHVESGLLTFTGAENFIDVAFGSAFADLTYKRYATASVTSDTDPQVGVTLRHIAVGGMRIEPDAPFVGQVSWKAEV